jgi:hypothetical protein
LHTTWCILQDVVTFPSLCGFLEARNLVFCLFTNLSRWKWASSLNHWQSKVAGYCCTNCKNSQ